MRATVKGFGTHCWQIPIVKASKKDQESIIELVDELLTLNNDTISSVNKFIRFLMEEYGLQTITKRIRNFYEDDFKTFVKALAQEGVKLTVKERYDLIDIFDLERIEIKSKIKEINRLNALLDLRICELYGLTKEEFEYILNNKSYKRTGSGVIAVSFFMATYLCLIKQQICVDSQQERGKSVEW